MLAQPAVSLLALDRRSGYLRLEFKWAKEQNTTNSQPYAIEKFNWAFMLHMHNIQIIVQALEYKFNNTKGQPGAASPATVSIA